MLNVEECSEVQKGDVKSKVEKGNGMRKKPGSQEGDDV
jgi:hypothetical protein